MTVNVKRDLRRKLRSLAGDEAARRRESAVVCDHILACAAYQNAKLIAGYISLGHEVDIRPLLRHALAQGKLIALPRCGDAPHMTFHLVDSLDELVKGKYGIPEPSACAQVISTEMIEFLLVPLECVDLKGNRLGKGGGYYDAALTAYQGFSLGCAFSWQIVPAVPVNEWDRRLNACAEATGIRYFSS